MHWRRSMAARVPTEGCSGRFNARSGDVEDAAVAGCVLSSVHIHLETRHGFT